MTRVSVITPTYNSARYIRQTVESVLVQTFRDFEYIVVDDGSTDETRAMLQPYVDAGKLTYIYQDNAERAVARNTGLRHATSEYLAFVDADDVWMPRKLQQQVDVLDAYPNVALVYGAAQYIDPQGQPVFYQGRAVDEDAATDLLIQDHSRRLVEGNTVCGGGSCVLTRRSLVEQIGRFDESLSYPEDWDMWVRLSRLGPFAYIPSVLMSYRVFGWGKVIKIEITERIIQQHLKIIDKLFLNWPQDVTERERLRHHALATYHLRVASYAYQAHQPEQGRTHLQQASEHDVSLGSRDRLMQLALDRAMLIERDGGKLEPAEVFLQEFFANLPSALTQHANAVKSALGWLYIGCAFDRFQAGNVAAARPFIWRGIRHAPSALKNRGVVSVATRSLLIHRS
jgi:glycosyltransferase involved in cell wall biosynthesis